MQLPLTLQLKPSRLYFAFLASGHALAGMAVCLLRLPGPWRAGLLLLLGLSLLRYWSLRRLPWRAITLRGDGRVELLPIQGAGRIAQIEGDSVVWPWLVVMHCRDEKRLPPLVFFPDAMQAADGHRQLRVWLQWRKEGDTA